MSERLWKYAASATLVLAAGSMATSCANVSADGFKGGCDKFRVYSQDRWAPLGTAVRQAPEVLSKEIDSFSGNEVIAVDGWVHTSEAAYPTNTAPWNSNIWFHLANQLGWVSYAGVRGEPTVPDPTGLASGGEPAPTTQACEGTYAP